MESSIELSNGSMIGPGGWTNLCGTETVSIEGFNGSVVDSEGGPDPPLTKTMSMMEHLSLELLEDGLDSFRTIHIRNQQNDIRNHQQENQILIGKSVVPTQPLVIDKPTKKSRSSIICKYWLSNDNCLKADCQFSHDFSNHVCKYVKFFVLKFAGARVLTV